MRPIDKYGSKEFVHGYVLMVKGSLLNTCYDILFQPSGLLDMSKIRKFSKVTISSIKPLLPTLQSFSTTKTPTLVEFSIATDHCSDLLPVVGVLLLQTGLNSNVNANVAGNGDRCLCIVARDDKGQLLMANIHRVLANWSLELSGFDAAC